MKKSILIASGILLTTASPAFAQSASSDSNPITVVTNALAGVEVVGAAANQAAKIINPGNNMIGSTRQTQRLRANNVYMSKSAATFNRITTANSNIGRYNVDQNVRIQNLSATGGSRITGNTVTTDRTTAGSIVIIQDARLQGVDLASSALDFNQIVQ